MIKRRLLDPIIFIIAFLFSVACMGPLPAPTPQPEATFTSIPEPSRTAEPVATPLPTVFPVTLAPTTVSILDPTATPETGFYRDLEQGFWFTYPDEWVIETTGLDLPSVILSDPDDPVKVIAGTTIVEDDLTIQKFATEVKDRLGFAEEVALLSDNLVVLADGSEAWEILLEWVDEKERTNHGWGYATISGGKGYLVLMVGLAEVVDARPQTMQAVAGSLKLQQPEFYGVSRQNSLVLAISEPVTLDPAITFEGTSGIVGLVFSGLVRLDETHQPQPDLADRWEISDDGLRYTFFLKENARFHDGQPISAATFKESWERATDPDLDSLTVRQVLGDIMGAIGRMEGRADSIAGVEVVNNTTLQVTLDDVRPSFLSKLTQPAAYAIDINNLTLGLEWWRQPNGSGPFTLRSWRPERVIILDRNENYHLTPPSIDSVVYIMGESGISSYEAGLVDVAPVHPRDLPRIQDPEEPLSGDLVSGHLMCTRLVLFDQTQPPFDDPDIRRAFFLTVNREQLAGQTLNKAAVAAASILPPGMPGYVERVPDDSYDIDRAIELINGSSYGDAAALPPIYLVTDGLGEPDEVVTALIDNWSTELDVEIRIDLLDPGSYIEDLRDHHRHLFTLNWCADYPDPENMLDGIFHTLASFNFGGYANEELDNLLERARSEQDVSARITLYQLAEEMILADAAAVPIVNPQTNLLVRAYVKGYQLSPIRLPWPATVSIERED